MPSMTHECLMFASFPSLAPLRTPARNFPPTPVLHSLPNVCSAPARCPRTVPEQAIREREVHLDGKSDRLRRRVPPGWFEGPHRHDRPRYLRSPRRRLLRPQRPLRPRGRPRPLRPRRRHRARLHVHRPQELLRVGRMRGARMGPVREAARGGRPVARERHHLPGRFPRDEGRRGAQPVPRVRDPAGHGVRGRPAAHAPLHGGLRADLRHLPALYQPGRHPRVFDRRVLHRRDPVPRALRQDPARAGRHAHGRGPARDGHLRHGRHRDEPLPRQGRARRDRQARARLHRLPRRGGVQEPHLAPPPHHRHLERGPGHRAAPGEVRRA